MASPEPSPSGGYKARIIRTPRPDASPSLTPESSVLTNSNSFNLLSLDRKIKVAQFQPRQLQMLEIATELKDEADRVMNMGGKNGFVKSNNIPVDGFPSHLYERLIDSMPSEDMIQRVWEAAPEEYHGLQTPKKLPFVFLAEGVGVQDMVSLLQDESFKKWYTSIGRETAEKARHIPKKILFVGVDAKAGMSTVNVWATATRVITIPDREERVTRYDPIDKIDREWIKTNHVSENALFDASINADWRLYQSSPKVAADLLASVRKANADDNGHIVRAPFSGLDTSGSRNGHAPDGHSHHHGRRFPPFRA